MSDYALREIVEASAERLRRVSAAEAARTPASGGWSVQEIIGHLVDSAANNHARFVRAQLQDDLVFPGYAQDAWVRVQQYATAPWPELLALWREYNRHVARVMAAVPDEARHRARHRHNLHQLAWQAVPESQPATLDYFMRDYVAHLQHHLRQVDALLDGTRT